MPRNVEIKARVRDLEQLLALAEHESGGPPVELRQEDTFFNVTSGRLKLRKEVRKSHLSARSVLTCVVSAVLGQSQ
jgi:adenylate cyclase class IV